MVSKPPPAQPDVSARPGAAPSRGAAIEDLPQSALVAEEEPSPPAPRVATAAREPQPEPPPLDEPYHPPVTAPPAPRATRGLGLGLAALAVALTAPFWEDSVLSMLGIRTPGGSAAGQSTLAVMRQERRTEDIAQRLAVATAQIARQQAAFAAAMQRADTAATLIRTMALVRLSDTLRRPMPFAAELAVVRASGTDLGDLKPLLDQIEPYADTGIPGTTQLRAEFRALLDQVPRGDNAVSPSWMSSLTNWVRPHGKPAPVGADPSVGLLQSASARLAEVDVAGALVQTRQVSEAYRPMFANWVEDAQTRVAADTLAEKVSDMVTRTLRTPGAK
jgi:hypothetical protein